MQVLQPTELHDIWSQERPLIFVEEYVKYLNEEVDKVIDSIHYEPVDFILHPSQAQQEFIDNLRKKAKELHLTKTDLMGLAKSDIASFGTSLLALDAFEGVDDEVLEEAFCYEAIVPLIKSADIILKIPTVQMSPTEFYNRILDYRNKERDEGVIDIRSDPMIFGLIGKIEDKTFLDIKKDLEEKHPLEIQAYINTRLQIARVDKEKIDIREFLDYAVEQLPNKLIHFLHNIDNLSQQQIELIVQNADNVLSNLKQIPPPVPKQIVMNRYEDLPQEEKIKFIENLIKLGRYEAIAIVLESLDTKKFAPDLKFLVSGIKIALKNAKKEQNFEDIAQLESLLNKSRLSKKTKEQKTYKTSEKVERYEFIKRKVTQEAARFYLYEWANYQLLLLNQQLKSGIKGDNGLVKEPQEFSNIADQTTFIDLEHLVKQERNKLAVETFEWMRRYAVVAVNSEMGYQIQKDRLSGDYVLPIDIIGNQELTKENIRLYLAKAEYIFPLIPIEMQKTNSRDAKSIAGDKWATIARVTKKRG